MASCKVFPRRFICNQCVKTLYATLIVLRVTCAIVLGRDNIRATWALNITYLNSCLRHLIDLASEWSHILSEYNLNAIHLFYTALLKLYSAARSDGSGNGPPEHLYHLDNGEI